MDLSTPSPPAFSAVHARPTPQSRAQEGFQEAARAGVAPGLGLSSPCRAGPGLPRAGDFHALGPGGWAPSPATWGRRPLPSVPREGGCRWGGANGANAREQTRRTRQDPRAGKEMTTWRGAPRPPPPDPACRSRPRPHGGPDPRRPLPRGGSAPPTAHCGDPAAGCGAPGCCAGGAARGAGLGSGSAAPGARVGCAQRAAAAKQLWRRPHRSTWRCPQGCWSCARCWGPPGTASAAPSR